MRLPRPPRVFHSPPPTAPGNGRRNDPPGRCPPAPARGEYAVGPPAGGWHAPRTGALPGMDRRPWKVGRWRRRARCREGYRSVPDGPEPGRGSLRIVSAPGGGRVALREHGVTRAGIEAGRYAAAFPGRRHPPRPSRPNATHPAAPPPPAAGRARLPRRRGAVRAGRIPSIASLRGVIRIGENAGRPAAGAGPGCSSAPTAPLPAPPGGVAPVSCPGPRAARWSGGVDRPTPRGTPAATCPARDPRRPAGA